MAREEGTSSDRAGGQLSSLEPWTRYLAGEWLSYLKQYGVSYRITSTRRSIFEQAKLYYDWVTGKSKIPAAFPGKSRHEFGTALDVVFNNLDPAEAAGIAEYFYLNWGGTRDPVHFELQCSGLDSQALFAFQDECYPFLKSTGTTGI